jgi:hypothetical protein
MSGYQCVQLVAAVLVSSGHQLYPYMIALQHGMDLFNYLFHVSYVLAEIVKAEISNW